MKRTSPKRKAAPQRKGKGTARARVLSWGDFAAPAKRGAIYLAAAAATVGVIGLATAANLDWSPGADPVRRGVQFASIIGSALFFALAAASGSKLAGRIGFGALAALCVLFNCWNAYQNAAHRNAERRDDLRGEIREELRYENERKELVAKRDRAALISGRETSDAIEAQIAAVTSSFIWRRSRECTDVTLPDSKALCDGYRALQTRREAAKEYARADFEIRTLDASRAGKKAPTSAAPEMDGLASWLALVGFQMSDEDKTVAAVLFQDAWPALMVELFAAFGPFGAFLLAGRLAAQPIAPAAPKPMAATVVDTPAEVSTVSRFMTEALEPTKGGRIEPGTLYAAYRRWCSLHGVEPVSNNRFGRDAGDLIKRDTTKRRQYLGYVLRTQVPAAPRVVATGSVTNVRAAA